MGWQLREENWSIPGQGRTAQSDQTPGGGKCPLGPCACRPEGRDRILPWQRQSFGLLKVKEAPGLLALPSAEWTPHQLRPARLQGQGVQGHGWSQSRKQPNQHWGRGPRPCVCPPRALWHARTLHQVQVGPKIKWGREREGELKLHLLATRTQSGGRARTNRGWGVAFTNRLACFRGFG